MKKILSFLLVIILAMSIMPLAVSAADVDEKIEFTYKSTEVDSENVALEVYMNVKSDVARLWGFDCVISYSKGLTLNNIVFGDLLPYFMNTPFDSANETNEIALSQDNGLSADKTINSGEYLVAKLNFKIEEGVDIKDIKFAFVEDTGSAVRSGNYENKLIVEFVSDTPAIMYGDINGDGNINGRDYAMLLQYVNGSTLSIDEAAADVNGDNNINGRDYAMLLQYVNGWGIVLGPKN